jgi:flagella basal body P-ring formation protein FlgA
MRKAVPQADITLLEYGRQPVPEGEIEFPANGLRANGAPWTGYVHYAATRRFAVWARVRAVVAVSRWVAAADLAPGKPIAAQQVRAETRQEFPALAPAAPAAEEVLGKWPRVAIRAGAAIRAEMLENPKEVASGDTVTVDVRNGGAHLELEARAEAAGAAGETIAVLNPATGKRFLARVEGKGKVSVILNAAQVNP